MEEFDRKTHWENIYQTKDSDELSWFQPTPRTSLSIMKQFNVPKSAKIIDVGGGDSFLVDHLLNMGYSNVTILDISEIALERAKERLGEKSKKVKWIVADAAHFKPTELYDFWHDRAAFHFLTKESEILEYIHMVQNSIKPGGLLVVGTFSESGPGKCSGIEVKQYSEGNMTERLKHYFDKIECVKVDHETPSGTFQNFIFCSFRKLKVV